VAVVVQREVVRVTMSVVTVEAVTTGGLLLGVQGAVPQDDGLLPTEEEMTGEDEGDEGAEEYSEEE
jgi:hypothetical protein